MEKIILPLKLLLLLSEMRKFLQPANHWYNFMCRKNIVNNNVGIKVEMTRGYVNRIKCLEFSQKTKIFIPKWNR